MLGKRVFTVKTGGRVGKNWGKEFYLREIAGMKSARRPVRASKRGPGGKESKGGWLRSGLISE